jgi:hypothetical protein
VQEFASFEAAREREERGERREEVWCGLGERERDRAEQKSRWQWEVMGQ